MPTPSLLIVPARFKSGRLYSQIPTANGDFTVTRATTATRVNASGLIESVASGIPRLDYFASGGVVGCPALLVEPSAQNLARHSENWTSTNNWQLSDGSGRVTVATATSGTTAPDGTSTANAITPTSGNMQHYLYSNSSGSITYASGTIYTCSAFFKKGAGNSGRYVQIVTAGGSTFVGNPYANFDLELGTTLTVSGSVADSNRVSRIQNYGNGWYRCSLTATCMTTTGLSVGVIVALLTGDTNARLGASFAGNTSDYIFGWGAQLETGSVATSYIPTTTAAITRNADVITVSGAVSGAIGQTEGTIYAEVDIRVFAAGDFATLYDGTTDNRIQIGLSSSVLNVIIRSGGTTDHTYQITGLSNAAGIYKIAVAYKANDYAVGLNGTVYTTTASRPVPVVLNRFDLGRSAGNFGYFNNRIRAVALYTTRLTNAQLQALTQP